MSLLLTFNAELSVLNSEKILACFYLQLWTGNLPAGSDYYCCVSKKFCYFMKEENMGAFRSSPYSTNIYLFKVNNNNARKRCKICSKLTMKTPERRHWRRSGVFIVNFEHISYFSFFIVDFQQVNANWKVCFLFNIRFFIGTSIEFWNCLLPYENLWRLILLEKQIPIKI